MRTKANYGIDSPYIIIGELIVGIGAIALAFTWPHLLGLPVRWIGLVVGLYCINSAVGMISYSQSGKLRIRDELLETIPWRGDEMVLDVGCGRGLLLVGAARRLTTGRAIGVDVWLPKALSGNEPDAALRNAVAEGVAERVDVKEGDARALPFPDEFFDTVVSNFVLHEMQTGPDREKMIREIARVLKPAGHLALVDFIFTKQCVAGLKQCGLDDARRARMRGFWMAAITSFGVVRIYKVIGAKAHPAR